MLKIHVPVHVLSDDAQFVRVVLSLAEIIAERTDDIGMVLDFHQLHCLLLVLVQFIEVFGLYLFQGVNLPSCQMDSLVYFGVLFTRTQYFQPLEIASFKHEITYLSASNQSY
jgi:hypothetical protein